jgi:hypothetical protein
MAGNTCSSCKMIISTEKLFQSIVPNVLFSNKEMIKRQGLSNSLAIPENLCQRSVQI